MVAHVLILIFFLALANAGNIPVFTRYETCVEATRSTHQNPFNYSEVVTRGTFGGPNGTVIIDGFYYQSFERSNVRGSEKLTPTGPPQWCIRYAPQHAGSYNVSFTITNSSGTFVLKTDSFEASDEGLAECIGIGSNNVHFQFTNGSTYYPIGENVCWAAESQGCGTYGYDDYFGKLAANGGNYARLWLTDIVFDDLAVEFAVGNMSLDNTWRLDYVVQLAEKLNIHLLMCTESYVYFCTITPVPCEWNLCYYNVADGGFLIQPQDFFTDERAKVDYKNRLRYLVARYAYSTSVFAWEFFNEVDICDGYNTSIQFQWNEEMSTYLWSIDEYDHPISTSFSNSNGDPTILSSSALDFTMTHNYGSSHIAADTALYAYKKLETYKKPSFVAEFGIGDEVC